MEASFGGHFEVRDGVAACAVAEAAQTGGLVFCSHTARTAMPILATDENALHVAIPTSVNLTDIEELDQSLDWPSYPSLLAIGAGRVTDVAKLLAFRHQLPLTVVPTVLSCNAFATVKAVVSVDGRHTTVRAQCPQHVLIDPVLLDQTEYRWHLLGLADVLSIHTALFDWDIAAQHGREQFDPLTAGWAGSLSERAMQQASVLPSASRAVAYHEIARMLLLSGMVTNFYGSGRPESGSEHCIARIIEQDAARPGRLWHGEAVLIGILLAASLQGQPDARLYGFASAAGLGDRLVSNGITGERLADYLLAAPFNRDDRFTILDVTALSRASALRLAAHILERLSRAPASERVLI